MAMNMMCKTQKANSQAFTDHYDRTFRSNQDIQYPEEIRAREIERKLNAMSSEDPKRKDS